MVLSHVLDFYSTGVRVHYFIWAEWFLSLSVKCFRLITSLNICSVPLLKGNYSALILKVTTDGKAPLIFQKKWLWKLLLWCTLSYLGRS